MAHFLKKADVWIRTQDLWCQIDRSANCATTTAPIKQFHKF